jgi:hypothetical protein
MNAHRYPDAVDASLVGSYPALAKAGGGYVWDDVLEYRVWCHPERGAPDDADGNDYYFAFATYDEAAAFSQNTKGAGEPLALVRQVEYIDEPETGEYRHVKKLRITEWPWSFSAALEGLRTLSLTFCRLMHQGTGSTSSGV